MEVIKMAEVKFTEEEMKSLKEIQESYFDVQNEYGKLELTRIRVEQQLDGLYLISRECRTVLTSGAGR